VIVVEAEVGVAENKYEQTTHTSSKNAIPSTTVQQASTTANSTATTQDDTKTNQTTGIDGPSKMYWTTFCAEKKLLVLTKLLKITLNIINLNIYVYFFSLSFIVSQPIHLGWYQLSLLVIFWKCLFFCNFWKCFFIF
jgi:hypothetical protein